MLRVSIDTSELDELLGIEEDIKSSMNEAAKETAEAIKGKIIELANSDLASTKDQYIEALSIREEGSDTYYVVLDKKMVWREEGMDAHSILDHLLKSPKAKQSKDGHTYVNVPFKIKTEGKGASSAQQTLIDTVKSELSKRNIDASKVEYDEKGNAKEGTLHRFDLTKGAQKTFEGPGTGKGDIGKPMRGPSGQPFLKGLVVSQKKDSSGKIKRAVTTFRTASSAQQGTGLWDHPGVDAANLFDKAFDWALDSFDEIIASKILDKIFK